MKTYAKLALGCGTTLVIIGIVFVMGLWKFVGFVWGAVSKVDLSKVEITTGPPSRPPFIPDGYQVEGDVVYYTRNNNFFGNWVPSRVPLEGVDRGTFQTIDSERHAKDAKHVFYKGVAIPGADPATFRASDTRYSGDANRTYYDDKVVEGAKGQDATSAFVEFDSMRARDKNHVYSDGIIVAGADPASFELIGTGKVGRDRHDYYAWSSLGNASPMIPLHVRMESFKLLLPKDSNTAGGDEPWDSLDGQMWGHDDQHYYVGENAYPIADPRTFDVLSFGYAKDSKQAYYLGTVIPGVDLATFKLVAPDHPKNWARDFARYAKDAKRIYYQGKVVEGADPETFTALDERIFKDKNHHYRYGRIETE